MKTVRPALVVLTAVVLMISAGASQAPTHLYAAMRVQAACVTSSLLVDNQVAFLAGAVAPELLVPGRYSSNPADAPWRADLNVKPRDAALIMNMLRLADEHKSAPERAFALGWLVHHCVDKHIQPLLAAYSGGPESDAIRAQLELVEAAHALFRGGSDLSAYVLDPAAIPVQFVCEAYSATYSDEPAIVEACDGPGSPLAVKLQKNAASARDALEWMIDTWQNPEAADFLGKKKWTQILHGTIPTPEQYKLLLNPLTITKTEAKSPDFEKGEKQPYLQVTFAVDDLRLFLPFCKAWQGAIKAAEDEATNYVKQWLRFPDRETKYADLTFDPPLADPEAGVAPEETAKGPGAPTITEMLGTIKVTDAEGNDVAVWPEEGQWLPCNPSAEAEQESLVTWAEPPAAGWSHSKRGIGTLRVPLPADRPGPLTVDLKLNLADKSTRAPYGVEASWSGKLDTGVKLAPEMSVCFLVDCSASMVDDGRLDAVKAALAQVVDATPDKSKGKIEWALMSYGGCTVRLISGFTTDNARIKTAAGSLELGRDTPLTYGLYKALTTLAKAAQGRERRLVIINDGPDASPNQCPEHKPMTPAEMAAPLQPLAEAFGATSALKASAAAAYVDPGEANAPHELSKQGETIQQALAEAREALKGSTFQLSVRTVGLGIKSKSEAEKWLENTARAGGGTYELALVSSELPAALTKVTSWHARQKPKAGAVIIYTPEEGMLADSPLDIEGATRPNGLLAIYTICYRKDTGEKLKVVPGTRRRADPNTGIFTFQAPLPRAGDCELRYEVHADLISDVGDHCVLSSATVNVFRKPPK